jgi:hypothetical protein
MTEWIDANVSHNDELVEALSEIQNEYALVTQDLKEAAQKAMIVMRSGALGMEFILNFLNNIPKTSAGGGARKRATKLRRKRPVRKNKGGSARMVGGNRFTQALSTWTPNPLKSAKKSWDGLTDKQKSIYKIIGSGTLAIATISVCLACPYIFGGAVVGAGIITGMHAVGVGLAAAWPYAVAIAPVAGVAAVALVRLARLPRAERELKELERIQARAKVLCEKYKKDDLAVLDGVVDIEDAEEVLDQDEDDGDIDATTPLTGIRSVAFGSTLKRGGFSVPTQSSIARATPVYTTRRRSTAKPTSKTASAKSPTTRAIVSKVTVSKATAPKTTAPKTTTTPRSSAQSKSASASATKRRTTP